MDKLKAFIVTNQSNIIIGLAVAVVILGVKAFKK